MLLSPCATNRLEGPTLLEAFEHLPELAARPTIRDTGNIGRSVENVLSESYRQASPTSSGDYLTAVLNSCNDVIAMFSACIDICRTGWECPRSGFLNTPAR